MFKFIIDEDLTRRIQVAVWHRNADVDILRVGDAAAPSYGASDAEVLRFAEQTERMQITDSPIADALVLIAESSTADEWRDLELWIPFS